MTDIAAGRELAQRLQQEYISTTKAGSPSFIKAMENIRNKAQFKQTQWRGWIKRITQNNKGQMEILFIVPFEQRAEVLELINAYGLPLDIYIKLFGEAEPEGWNEPEWGVDE